jgi:hypothetical protein
MRLVAVTSLLLVGCAPPPALAAGDDMISLISLSCQWNIDQTKWSNSGEVLDKGTYAESDNFLLDKRNMTATKGSLAVSRRTYKMTMADHFINLKFNDDHDYIDYSFDRRSFSMSEHRTILFSQGRITFAGTGRCSIRPKRSPSPSHAR